MNPVSWSGSKLFSKGGIESKKEGKDEKLIQSSTTPDPGHHIGK